MVLVFSAVFCVFDIHFVGWLYTNIRCVPFTFFFGGGLINYFIMIIIYLFLFITGKGHSLFIPSLFCPKLKYPF